MIGLLVGLVVGAVLGAAAAERRRRRLDREREAVFAFAAHELASPTTGIQLTLRNLLQGLFGEVPADQRRWLEVSQDQIHWLGGVASDLGDLAHLELGGRLRLTPGVFDAQKSVERAVEGWKRLSERWGVKLDSKIIPGPAVSGDGERIGRVITNLIGHALRFSVSKGDVGVSLAEGADGVRVSVEWSPIDPAVGPEDALDRFCVSSSGKTLKISGIGLTVAREIVERSGGALKGEREGARDRFVLTLPRSA